MYIIKKMHIGKRILLFVAAAFILLPLIYTITNAFMGNSEILYYYGSLWNGEERYMPFHLFPDRWSLENLYVVLLSTPDYLIKFWNSVGLTTAIVTGELLLSVLAGYGFSRFRFPGRNILFVLVIIIMMMPYQVTLVSNYIILNRLGLVGSYASVILPGVFSSFGVFFMKQAMDEIPPEILEAAKLDGAGQWRTLAFIVLPMSRGGILSLLLLTFIDNWNMVEQPQVFLREERMYPLSVLLARSAADTGAAGFACGVLALLPVMLLYMNFKEELVNGIAASGIK